MDPISDRLFELSIPHPLEEFGGWPPRPESDKKNRTIVRFRPLRSDGDYYCDPVIHDTRPVFDCPRDPSHGISRLPTRVESEIFGSYRPRHFVLGDALAYITTEFKEAIEQSGLVGAWIFPLTVPAWQVPDGMEIPLFILASQRTIRIPGTVIVQGENRCHKCGHGPIVCPECGQLTPTCPNCGVQTFHEIGKIEDGRTVVTDAVFDKSRWRILGRSWDGSDFVWWFDKLFVTSRVINFLIGLDARPFIAEPVPVDIEGMSAERLEHLRQMPPTSQLP